MQKSTAECSHVCQNVTVYVQADSSSGPTLQSSSTCRRVILSDVCQASVRYRVFQGDTLQTEIYTSPDAGSECEWQLCWECVTMCGVTSEEHCRAVQIMVTLLALIWFCKVIQTSVSVVWTLNRPEQKKHCSCCVMTLEMAGREWGDSTLQLCQGFQSQFTLHTAITHAISVLERQSLTCYTPLELKWDYTFTILYSVEYLQYITCK